MNRIVREHYPVSRLPEDLREGLAEHARVTVVVSDEAGDLPAPSFREIFDGLRDLRVASGDPVTRVRALREAWKEREQFRETIRRGEPD